MSTLIPRDAVTVLPDSIVAGSCKFKQAFSLNDLDNIEVAWLATQAAKKKAKLSKLNSSEKKTTNQKSHLKSNCQLSIEEVEDIDNTQHHVFSQNPKNILELSDDNNNKATKGQWTSASLLFHKKRKLTINWPQNWTLQPSVEDMDDPCVLPCNPRNVLESNDNDDEASNFPATSWATSWDVNDNDDDEDVVGVC